MSTQIPSSTSHILVLRKVRVSFLSKRLNNLTPIRLDKHCIELLFSNMALANGFELQTTSLHYLRVRKLQAKVLVLLRALRIH